MDVNPEIDQDRVFDLVDTFRKHGVVMFHEQRKIYENIAGYVTECSVLEAGCGNGVGSPILSGCLGKFIATDKLGPNVKFAEELYPWLDFEVWDINYPTDLRAEIVVAIEVFEHVANPQAAMNNLIGAASKEVWLSTPNGTNKPRPPENPYHVCEYTPEEVLTFARGRRVVVYDYDTMEEATWHTTADPLIYRIIV